MANLNIRFRTQDTLAGTARKLNQLLGLDPDATDASKREIFRATPQPHGQWQLMLNGYVQALAAAKRPKIDGKVIEFRTADTRQLWTRKLNLLSAAVQG